MKYCSGENGKMFDFTRVKTLSRLFNRIEHCSTVTSWNNVVDNLFIVGRTTLFTPVDINLEQPVRFYPCSRLG
jgi:hypothetical protein